MRDHTKSTSSPSFVLPVFILTCLLAAAALAFARAERQEPASGRPGGRGPGGLSGLALFMALDQDGQPGLSDVDLSGAEPRLKSLDKNGDGQLSADELPVPARGGRGGPGGRGRGEEPGNTAPASADDLTETLMAFDQNKDGRLTKAEVPERFQGLFDRADANRDGVLTPEELKQSASTSPQAVNDGRGRGGDDGREGGEGRRGRGGPFGGRDPLVVAIDTDGDGRLSASEQASVVTVIRRFDRNGDGVITLDEIFGGGFGRGRG